MFLAYVSNGAHQRDAIAELPLILMVVLLQHCFPDLGAQILLQLARCHHAVYDHVWNAQRQLYKDKHAGLHNPNMTVLVKTFHSPMSLNVILFGAFIYLF